MATIARPSAATKASPTPGEQSITASLTAEIMYAPDTGQATLLAATEANLGDLAEVTPAQLLAKVSQLRTDADRIEQLAAEYAATVVLPAFIEHYAIDLIETSTNKLVENAPELAASFRAFSALKNDGTFIVVVPEGQPPIERLAAIRDLVLDLRERTAA